MNNLTRRLDRIERTASATASDRRLYASIPAEDLERLQDPNTPAAVRAELTTKYGSLPCKVYGAVPGFTGPDDWD